MTCQRQSTPSLDPRGLLELAHGAVSTMDASRSAGNDDKRVQKDYFDSAFEPAQPVLMEIMEL